MKRLRVCLKEKEAKSFAGTGSFSRILFSMCGRCPGASYERGPKAAWHFSHSGSAVLLHCFLDVEPESRQKMTSLLWTMCIAVKICMQGTKETPQPGPYPADRGLGGWLLPHTFF